MDDVKKKILLLGATGFVGQSIMQNFPKNEFDIKGLASRDLDLTNQELVFSQIPQYTKSRTVIMTAVIARDKDKSADSMLKNIAMDTHVMEALPQNEVKHLIYISSSDVYGRKDLTLPLNEKSQTNPSNYYATSKLTSEYIVKQQCNKKNIPLTILRLAPVYGPGDTHNSPIQKFFISAMDRQRIELIGNGKEIRDFVYIDDVAKGIQQVIEKKVLGVFNVVSGESCRIKDIIKIIEELCGYPLQAKFKQDNDDDDVIFEESNFLKDKLNLNVTTIQEGLTRTFKNLASLQSIEV